MRWSDDAWAPGESRRVSPSTIVGYIDGLGHLWCRRCHPCAPSPHTNHVAVFVNSDPHAFEACDACGEVVNGTA